MHLSTALIGQLKKKSNRNVMARLSLRPNGKVSEAITHAKCTTRRYGLKTDAAVSKYAIPPHYCILVLNIGEV